MAASGSRRYLMRAVLCLTVGSTGLFGCGRLARAQTQVGPARSATDADVPAAVATPGPTSPPSDFAHRVDEVEAGDASAFPEFLPGTLPPDAGAGAEMGLLGLIGESIFGNRSDLWRPLPLSTFFSEGWLEPWYPCPRSTTGAPRQGWINAYDGVFYRLFFFDFSYVNDFQKNGNEYLGTLTLFTPISRRFQLRFDVPFIASNKGGQSNTYHGNFGDFDVSPRILLSESQDFSQVFECIVRTPTGSTVNGNGQTTLTPQYEFWYGGLPGGGVIRGGTGLTIPTNNAGVTSIIAGAPATVPGARTTCNYNLAVGKYWTQHDATPGDFVTFLSLNGFTTLDDRGPIYSYFSVTPAFRFHLGNN
ncbi:MAG: hypothetical protein WA746_09805, partial [Isosphaeraceae bacterium]